MFPLVFTNTLARTRQVGFTYGLARICKMGITIVMARIHLVGFTKNLARTYLLGFVRCLARISVLGFTHGVAIANLSSQIVAGEEYEYAPYIPRRTGSWLAILLSSARQTTDATKILSASSVLRRSFDGIRSIPDV